MTVNLMHYFFYQMDHLQDSLHMQLEHTRYVELMEATLTFAPPCLQSLTRDGRSFLIVSISESLLVFCIAAFIGPYKAVLHLTSSGRLST